MVFTNGFAGEAPLQGFGLQGYHAASAHAVIGTLLALLDRSRNGRGQQVDVSLQEAVVGALEQTSAAWNSERRIEIRRGPVHWTRVFRTCRCRDGFVMLCLLADWTTIVGWLMERGYGTGFTGEAWESFYYRRDHCEEIYEVLDRWAADLSAEEILEGAQLRRLPFAAVRPPEALLDDPQLAARGFFAPIPMSETRFPGPSFRMSRTPMVTPSGPPRLGEHAWPASAPCGSTLDRHAPFRASSRPRRGSRPRFHARCRGPDRDTHPRRSRRADPQRSSAPCTAPPG